MPRLAAIAVLVPLLLVAGCQAAYGKPGARYPYTSEQAEVLDVQVFLQPTELVFTNSTARSFGPTRVWLNQRFSREIDGIDVGQTVRIDLAGFRDEFGERWRGGGFFATEQPERLVLAQLEPLDADTRTIIGMVVVAREEN